MIVGDDAEECTKLFHVFRRLQCKNGFDFLGIWFNATRSEPVTKEVSFLNGPFTFARVYKEAFCLKSKEDFVNEGQVRVKTKAETCDVVDVDFNVKDIAENKFHDFLSDVR